MDISRETLDTYTKNLWCLRDLTDQLMGTMKGQTASYRPLIADRTGKLVQKNLSKLIEEMLSGWAAHVREGIYPDRPGEESAAEPYLRAREELYRLYLSLTMQCSLCSGAYALVGGDEEDPERPDFAYLLEQARQFARTWCVVQDPDGTRHNLPYEGFDACFGFHLFHVLSDPEDRSADSFLTPSWKRPCQDISQLTNLGNMKRIHRKRLSPPPAPADPDGPRHQDGPALEDQEEDWDPYADFGPEEDEDYDPFADSWDSVEMPIGVSPIPEDEIDEGDRTSWLLAHAARLEGHEEDYLDACKRFVSLYDQADPDVLRGFCDDLEDIVNLYLLVHGLSPLINTDNTLDVYSRLYDYPLQQAQRYARVIQWKRL